MNHPEVQTRSLVDLPEDQVPESAQRLWMALRRPPADIPQQTRAMRGFDPRTSLALGFGAGTILTVCSPDMFGGARPAVIAGLAIGTVTLSILRVMD